MWDHLVEYLDGGGSVFYLGANGVFERCSYHPTGTAVIYFDGDPSQGRDRNFLRNLDPPRAERSLLGVAYRFNNWLDQSKPSPLAVLKGSHRYFQGTARPGGGLLQNGDLIGLTGRNRQHGQDPSFGAASGWEMDTSEPAEADAGVVVNAWVPGWPVHGGPTLGTDRGVPPAGLDLLARGTNTGEGTHSADMTCYRHGGGGLVFAAGSLTFGGSLVEDPNLQTVVLNAVDDSLGWFDPTSTRYAAIWDLNDGSAWQARTGQTGEQFTTVLNDFVGAGFRLTDISANCVGNQARYASIWDVNDGRAWQVHFGEPEEQFASTLENMVTHNYRLTRISGCSVNGQVSYSSIWEVNDGRPWQVHFGEPAAQFEQTVHSFSAQGYRLTSVTGSEAAGEVRYGSVWEMNYGREWRVHFGQHDQDYQRTFDDLLPQNFRLVDISGYAADGQLQYASLWEINDGRNWQARHGLRGGPYQRMFNRMQRHSYRVRHVSMYSLTS
jgi:hypothetical protein